MLTSYVNFEKELYEMMKIRSANFVNLDCDLRVIMRTVYNDIISTVSLDTLKFAYEIPENGVFILPEDDHDENDPDKPITMRYGVPSRIVDEDELDIEELIIIRGENEYELRVIDLEDQVGKTVYFYRPVVYSIEYLPPKYYDEIFSAMIEGMIYQIETSIPSNIDGQLSNLSFQRFFNEKNKIQTRYPKIDL